MADKFYTYPETYSPDRPFFLEIWERNGKTTYQTFRAQYLDYNKYEVHPWNLGLEGEFVNSDYISFFTKDFLKYTVDALNDKFERDRNK